LRGYVAERSGRAATVLPPRRRWPTDRIPRGRAWPGSVAPEQAPGLRRTNANAGHPAPTFAGVTPPRPAVFHPCCPGASSGATWLRGGKVGQPRSKLRGYVLGGWGRVAVRVAVAGHVGQARGLRRNAVVVRTRWGTGIGAGAMPAIGAVRERRGGAGPPGPAGWITSSC